MFGQIILALSLMIIVFYNRKKVVVIEESKREWLIFFLIFIGIMLVFSIDLVTRFSYTRLLVLSLIFIFITADFYKRYKKIRLK